MIWKGLIADRCFLILYGNVFYVWTVWFLTYSMQIHTYYIKKYTVWFSKIGTASLIKFRDNSNNKKKHFLHLAREVNFYPFHKQKYHKYNISFILWSFLANITGHNYIFVTSFLQLSTVSNNKKYFKKVFKSNFES